MKNQLRNDAWGPTIFWVWPLQDSSKELCRDQPGFGAAKWYEWILSIHKLGRGAITMI